MDGEIYLTNTGRVMNLPALHTNKTVIHEVDQIIRGGVPIVPDGVQVRELSSVFILSLLCMLLGC